MKEKLLEGYLQVRNGLARLARGSEKGQNTTEYGIFIAGVVIVVLLVVGIFSGALKTLWDKVASLIAGG